MAHTKVPMNSNELREILQDLDLTQPQLADLAGSGLRAAKKWVSGESAVPAAVALLFRLMRENPGLLEEAWEKIGLPDGGKTAPRGRPKKGE